jgi:hypothetical protein
MDISHFFKGKDYNKTPSDYKFDFIGKIQKYKNSKKLSLHQCSQIIDYLRQGGPISLMHSINNILNKFDDLKKEIKNSIPHHMISTDDAHKLISKLSDNEDKHLSNDQKTALKKLIEFLYDPAQSTFGLFGYAGTGKTTLITELIYFLRTNKLIQNVALTAPTNQAVNVLKSKMHILKNVEKIDNKIDFITIHKLLQYENDFNVEGERVFIKTKKSLLEKYNIIIIDEVSMISKSIIETLFTDIFESREKGKIPKIIFVGDPAQLPPVNERVSPLFLDKTKLDNRHILTQIVRNNNSSVNNLCNELRKWVTGEINFPKIGKYKSDKVHFYHRKKNIKNHELLWGKKFLRNSYINNSIIITWTNIQSNEYNDAIRKKTFEKNTLKKYEVGDKLIFNDYYVVYDEEGKINTRFHTSDQVRVTGVRIITQQFDKLSRDYPAKKKNLKESPTLESKYLACIDLINKGTTRRYKLWKLTVVKLFGFAEKKMGKVKYDIYVLHNDSIKTIEQEKKYAITQIKNLISYYKTSHKRDFNNISNFIIKPLWRRWSKLFFEPYSDVDYGNSITCHKSQGSTHFNVFIDIDNILKNPNDDEAKRCIYVGCTRPSNEIHILMPVKKSKKS